MQPQVRPRQTFKPRQTLIGMISSDVRNKTITVKITRYYKHPLLKKYMKATTICHVHDELNLGKQGQRACIEQCRPLSKTKRWTLKHIVDANQEENHDLPAN
jgi:small subunit ribosomal protein S17